MKTPTRVLAAAIFALALPLSASAQTATAAPAAAKLEVGKWTGTVTPPSGEVMELEFNVTNVSDTTKIDLTIAAMSYTTPLVGIKLEDKKLSFSFLAGDTDVTCKLEKKEDGSYAGPCASGSGESGPMVMTPPKKPAAGGGTH